MSRIYDNWEKLVEAVLDKEELKRLALCESFSSSLSASSAYSREGNFSYHDVQARPMELTEIVKATKNFGPDGYVGEGIFSQAFKAWIDEQTLAATKPGFGMPVTVKKWNPISGERHQDWVKEVHHLTELRHPNLIELVGYCIDEDNMILVYKFMDNGNLSEHFFGRHASLPWETRIKVAIDVASGLSYLHEMERPIIHRDFKTANILLDDECNAKLSNYCYGRDDPIHTSTNQLVLTYGYDAPELAWPDQVTTKYNVYSFGVILLELLSGRLVRDLMIMKDEQRLDDWARQYLGDERKLLSIVDTRLKGKFRHSAVFKVAKIALQCLSSDPNLRPTMSEVLVGLKQL